MWPYSIRRTWPSQRSVRYLSSVYKVGRPPETHKSFCLCHSSEFQGYDKENVHESFLACVLVFYLILNLGYCISSFLIGSLNPSYKLIYLCLTLYWKWVRQVPLSVNFFCGKRQFHQKNGWKQQMWRALWTRNNQGCLQKPQKCHSKINYAKQKDWCEKFN